MATLKHTCTNCDSTFSVKYDELNTESDPTWCPFCAEMMFFDDDPEDDSEDI